MYIFFFLLFFFFFTFIYTIYEYILRTLFIFFCLFSPFHRCILRWTPARSRLRPAAYPPACPRSEPLLSSPPYFVSVRQRYLSFASAASQNRFRVCVFGRKIGGAGGQSRVCCIHVFDQALPQGCGTPPPAANKNKNKHKKVLCTAISHHKNPDENVPM